MLRLARRSAWLSSLSRVKNSATVSGHQHDNAAPGKQRPAGDRRLDQPKMCRSVGDAVVRIGNVIRLASRLIGRCSFPMIDFLRLLVCALTRLFRSRARLEAEILVLRHQLNVLRRKVPKRVVFRSVDRLVLAGLYRLAPSVLDSLKILKPETVIRWHRAGSGPFGGGNRGRVVADRRCR